VILLLVVREMYRCLAVVKLKNDNIIFHIAKSKIYDGSS